MRKLLLSLTAVFVLMCPLFSLFVSAAELSAAPALTATNAIVMHLNTGITAYEKNADEKVFPGSAAKVMTAILAMEKGSLDTQVEASSKAFEGITTLSSAKIQKGEILTVKELLYCLLVATSNEAANILAVYVSGDVPTFVKAMNEKAKQLGAVNTYFNNAQGIYDESSYSTARDAAKITEYASKMDGFMEIVNTTVYKLPPTNKTANQRILYSNNQLIISTSSYYSSLAKGIKTASTAEGGASLSVIGEKKVGKEVQKVLVVVMGCKKSETNTALNHTFIDSKALINWFYQNHKVSSLVKKNDPAIEIKVELSDSKDHTLLLVEDNFSTLVPVDFSTEKLTREYLVPESVMAPVKKGQVVGTMVLSYNNVEYGRVNLISQTAIKQNAMLFYSYQLNLFFKNIWVRTVAGLVGGIFLLYLIYTIFYNNKHKRGRRVKRRIKF